MEYIMYPQKGNIAKPIDTNLMLEQTMRGRQDTVIYITYMLYKNLSDRNIEDAKARRITLEFTD